MNKPKGIVFDMDGVLRVGNNPIPHACDIINIMIKNNIPGMVSTNECRYTEKVLRKEQHLSRKNLTKFRKNASFFPENCRINEY